MVDKYLEAQKKKGPNENIMASKAMRKVGIVQVYSRLQIYLVVYTNYRRLK